MRTILITLALCVCTLALGGCKSSDPHSAGPAASTTASPAVSPVAPNVSPSPTAPATSLKSKIDPCQLLTSDEVKAAQGEQLQSASRSDRESPDFVIAQCYYQLPTASKSVVVNITTAKPGGKSPRESWRRTFVENEGGREKGESGEKKHALKKFPELATTLIGKPAALPPRSTC